MSVSADKNSVFAPSGTATGASGTFTGLLTIGSDRTNRTITVTATSNGISKQTTVNVAGISGPGPTPVAVADSAILSDKSSIINTGTASTITLTGTVPGVAGLTGVTDFSGHASRTITAPATTGTYPVGATGNGVTAADTQVRVVTAGVTPAAIIPPGAMPSLSASPNVLSVNAFGSTTNRSTLRFLFLEGAGNPVTNVRVHSDDLAIGDDNLLVAGWQGMADRPFETDVLQSDVANGSFLMPAYGVNNCTTPN